MVLKINGNRKLPNFNQNKEQIKTKSTTKVE